MQLEMSWAGDKQGDRFQFWLKEEQEELKLPASQWEANVQNSLYEWKLSHMYDRILLCMNN